MKIVVHIKGISAKIQCSSGHNSIQWLADSALVWLQNVKHQTYNENPVKVCLPTGEPLTNSARIQEVLNDGDNVFVYMKEDVEFMNLGRN